MHEKYESRKSFQVLFFLHWWTSCGDVSEGVMSEAAPVSGSYAHKDNIWVSSRGSRLASTAAYWCFTHQRPWPGDNNTAYPSTLWEPIRSSEAKREHYSQQEPSMLLLKEAAANMLQERDVVLLRPCYVTWNWTLLWAATSLARSADHHLLSDAPVPVKYPFLLTHRLTDSPHLNIPSSPL